jgi:chorismate mutase
MAEERAVNPEPPRAEDLIADLRRRIDDLDDLLVRTLSARAACALEVGRQKKLLGLEIYQPGREADVLAHVQKVNPGPLNNESMKRLFERIIDEARRLEREAEPDEGKGGGA